MTDIRILITDDHPLVREGIRARLENEEGYHVVGEAQNGLEALQLAEQLDPDVVLMDISMPEMNGFEATRRFKEQRKRGKVPKILILTMHEQREYIVKMVQSGASGYVLKDVGSDELIRAIDTVHSGGTYFSAGVSDLLFSELNPSQTPKQETHLTQREEMVLTLLAEGHCTKEIAQQLSISVRTVETHRQNIKSKLDIHTAAGLTRYALTHNLVKL